MPIGGDKYFKTLLELYFISCVVCGLTQKSPFIATFFVLEVVTTLATVEEKEIF